jgi:hypothetical protein
LGERTCLGAVWGGEHDGVLGFVGGATGGENPFTGVFPLASVALTRGPALSAAACAGERPSAGRAWRTGPHCRVSGPRVG